MQKYEKVDDVDEKYEKVDDVDKNMKKSMMLMKKMT